MNDSRLSGYLCLGGRSPRPLEAPELDNPTLASDARTRNSWAISANGWLPISVDIPSRSKSITALHSPFNSSKSKVTEKALGSLDSLEGSNFVDKLRQFPTSCVLVNTDSDGYTSGLALVHAAVTLTGVFDKDWGTSYLVWDTGRNELGERIRASERYLTYRFPATTTTFLPLPAIHSKWCKWCKNTDRPELLAAFNALERRLIRNT